MRTYVQCTYVVFHAHVFKYIRTYVRTYVHMCVCTLLHIGSLLYCTCAYSRTSSTHTQHTLTDLLLSHHSLQLPLRAVNVQVELIDPPRQLCLVLGALLQPSHHPPQVVL